ncbi:MAG: hypothetical protein MR966_06265 [Lachnospiraceae bacterium]|nr:hypothetical protein [Lachnospiraceae bacterium]
MENVQKIAFSNDILAKLRYFNHTQMVKRGSEEAVILEYGDQTVYIEELKESGTAHLAVEHCYPVIAFKGLDLNQWTYLNYPNASDGLILEFTGDRWRAHIFELKKKVNNAHWAKAKKQFAGTYLYLKMIKGVLDITVDENDILYYVGYRQEEIQEQKNATPIELHRGLHSGNHNMKSTASVEWEKGQTVLQLYKGIRCKFQKIVLDSQTGEGVCTLSW